MQSLTTRHHAVAMAVIAALAGLATTLGTASIAQAAATGITAHLDGSATPANVNGVVVDGANVVTDGHVPTGLYLRIVLSDNQNHAKATVTVTKEGVSSLTTGRVALPALKGHSYVALVTYGWQTAANTGRFTYRTVVFPGGRVGAGLSGAGLSWN